MICRGGYEKASCSGVPSENSALTGRAENALIIGAGQRIEIAGVVKSLWLPRTSSHGLCVENANRGVGWSPRSASVRETPGTE